MATLGAIVAFAALLRLWRLGTPGLWSDEAASWLLVRDRLSDLLGYLRGDVHPPLYYLLLWCWIRVAGASEWALRFLSAAAGVLSVPLMYAAGRELVPSTQRAGLWAAILLAVSPYHVHYGQETKSYAVLLLFSLAGFWMLARALRRTGAGPGTWIAYTVLMAAALHVHVTAVFLLPGFAVFAWMSEARRRAVLTLLPGFLFLPWLLVAGWSQGHVDIALSWADHWFESRFPWQPALSLAAFAPTAAPPQRNLMQVWSAGSPGGPIPELAWLLPGVILMLVLAVSAFRRESRAPAGRIAVIPLLALAGLFTASLVRVVYLVGRTDAIALPFWILLCAIGAAAVVPTVRGTLILATIWLLLAGPSLWMQYTWDFRSEDRALLHAGLGQARPGDTLVLTGERLSTGLYYVEGPGRAPGAPDVVLEAFPAILWEHPAWETASAYDSAVLAEEARGLADSLADRRVLLLLREPSAPERALVRAMRETGRPESGSIRPEGEDYPRWLVYEPKRTR